LAAVAAARPANTLALQEPGRQALSVVRLSACVHKVCDGSFLQQPVRHHRVLDMIVRCELHERISTSEEKESGQCT
jgi:hypothetical protein